MQKKKKINRLKSGTFQKAFSFKPVLKIIDFVHL